jgi:hypothetical protein
MKRRFLLAAALALGAGLAQAHSFELGNLKIGHPYARATVPGQTAGGGFLSVENKGSADDKLLSARAAVSQAVELHMMSMEGNVMKMRPVDAIAVPAGKTVKLEPGGLHIMFVGLKAPLAEGDSFPMTLRFEKAGEVTVTVKVEVPKSGGGGHDGHGK